MDIAQTFIMCNYEILNIDIYIINRKAQICLTITYMYHQN